MASTITAATMKVKITETINLNGKDQGGTTTLSIGSITNVVKRIVNIGTDEFGVKVDKGCSFIYGVDLDNGVVDTMDSADAAGITPDSFGDLVDITCAANTAACDVEVFVAST